jgi:hypothetical protein
MPMEGTLDFYLNQGTALRMIYEKAEPYLFWTQFIRPVQETSAAFIYRYDSVGMDSDPKKKKPAHVMIGGDFPEIDMSRPSITSAMTESRGFSVRIKRQVIREEPKGVSEVTRAYQFAGFWMARFLNDNILAAIVAGATTPTWTPTAVWSAATATPVDDMIRLEAQMEREGYPYALTDVMVHKDNWYELKAYLTSVDINDAKQRMMYGVPEIKKDQMTIPVVGADIWKVKSGLTEGYALGLDRNNPCAEMHYYVDSKFGTDTVSYNTIVNGVPTMQTAANLGFHFEQIEDPNNHDTIMKFWVESKAVVTEAYAALYDNGI